jgi:DcuC family C4-dicarboxylate transporter
MEMAPLGTLASLAGSLGRSMSPVAGAAIVVSGIAGVNPIEVAKRNAPGMILASIVAFVMMGL